MKEKFDESEWFLLTATPSLVAAAMAGAGRSGFFGTMKEALVGVTTLVEGQRDYPSSQLVQELANVGAPDDEVRELAKRHRELALERLEGREARTPEQLRALALSDLDTVKSLLERVPEGESKAYLDWVLGIATKVAESAKEGGFLGFGGERVSEEEERFLAELRARLL